MSDLNSQQADLLGHLLGALDDDEQEELSQRLRHDVELREQLDRVGGWIEPLLGARYEYSAPPGLADRTCKFVAARAKAEGAAFQRSPMTAVVAPPSWISSIRWLDVAMAVGIFVTAALLTVPAVQHSRFQSRLLSCQFNLGELGRMLKSYSSQHGDQLPVVPKEGLLAMAGIYAPVLQQNRLLDDAARVVCPDSPLADQQDFRIPTLDELQSMSPVQFAGWKDRLGGSYGYCLGYVRDGVYHPTRDLGRTHFALMADAPSANRPCYSDNHAGGQNVLWEDGHVGFMTTSRIVDDADDFYFNDNGLPAAGLHLNDSVIVPSGTAPILPVEYR